MNRAIQNVFLGSLSLMLLGKASNAATLSFAGACDASAAVAMNRDLFVVASDEDNILRVYSRLKPGNPVSRFRAVSILRTDKLTAAPAP